MSGSPEDELTWHLKEVDAQRMKVLALLLGDPNPIHFDPDVARRTGVANVPVNQGPSTMAMIYNLLADSHPRHRVCRLAVRLKGNVLAGQEVTVTARPEGAQHYTVDVCVDDDKVVMQGRAELVERASS